MSGERLGLRREALSSPSFAVCLLRAKAAAAAAMDEAGLGGRALSLAGAERPWQEGRVDARSPVQVPTAAAGHLQPSFSCPIHPGFWALPYRLVGLGGDVGAWGTFWVLSPQFALGLLCLLARRPKRQCLTLWVPAAFVATHSLLNRYKLVALVTLAAPSPR